MAFPSHAFSVDGYSRTDFSAWLIGAETPHPIYKFEMPPNFPEFYDKLTGRTFWPYLPHVDLDILDGEENARLMVDLLGDLHDEYRGSWTELKEAGVIDRTVDRVLEGHGPDAAKALRPIVDDLVLWATSMESEAIRGRRILRTFHISPQSLATFPYNPAGLTGADLEEWHGELRRSLLHQLVHNATMERDNHDQDPQWYRVGEAAVVEWLGECARDYERARAEGDR